MDLGSTMYHDLRTKILNMVPGQFGWFPDYEQSLLQLNMGYPPTVRPTIRQESLYIFVVRKFTRISDTQSLSIYKCTS